MITDPISDMLTRIRNASAVHKPQATASYSQSKFAVAKILQSEGYLRQVDVTGEGTYKQLILTLKYTGKLPAITHIKRISKPGQRVYRKAEELRPVLSGRGFSIVSTSNGMMTNNEARSRRLGGEVICEIY